MYRDVLDMLSVFFATVLSSLAIQNAVFSRSLGISRLISLVDDTTDTFVFGVLLTFTTLFNSLGCFFVDSLFLARYEHADYIRPVCFTVITGVVFLAVFLVCAKISPARYLHKATRALPFATFNCLVLGTALLCVSRGLDLVETLGFALGSSVGFIIAVLMVTEVQRKLRNRMIPAAFKGLPATLLYLAALAMAVYGLTGFSLSL